jgi:hypothetical protein
MAAMLILFKEDISYPPLYRRKNLPLLQYMISSLWIKVKLSISLMSINSADNKKLPATAPLVFKKSLAF